MVPHMIAVIGAANATKKEKTVARKVGSLTAKMGWTVVCGGLGGVMEAASRGAHEAHGTVVGILPQGSKEHANRFVTIPIATNIGYARNMIIAHTGDAFIAIGGSEGTLSEIAIARKLGKPVFSLDSWNVAGVVPVSSAEEAVDQCKRYFDVIHKK